MVEVCTLKCAASDGKNHQRLPCCPALFRCPKQYLINPQITPTLALFLPLGLAPKIHRLRWLKIFLLAAIFRPRLSIK
eukprot:c13646_g2_i1 orf=65-298(+)